MTGRSSTSSTALRSALDPSRPTSIGRVTSRPRSRRSDQQLGDQRRVLGRALHQRQRVLDPSMSMPSATTQQDSAKCTPSIINATRSSPDRSARQQLGQRGFGHRHELARDRGFACRRGCFSDLLADRLQPDRVTAGRQPGQHLLHRHLAQDLRRAEQLIGRRPAVRPHPSAARTRGRVIGTRRPPSVTDPRSRPWRTAVRVASCLPFGPASAVTSASINAAITCRPAPTARASSPSCMFSAISVIATLTRSGIAGALASTGWIWLLFFTAVPLLLVFLAERPTPTTRQESSGGPPPRAS